VEREREVSQEALSRGMSPAHLPHLAKQLLDLPENLAVLKDCPAKVGGSTDVGRQVMSYTSMSYITHLWPG
jgi:hypothetical protein